MFENISPEVRHSAAGAAGALMALLLMRDKPWTVRIVMFIGGCILAWLGGEWLAIYFDMQRATSLVGFLVGIFGMRIIAKAYDMIEALDAKDAWERFWKKIGL